MTPLRPWPAEAAPGVLDPRVRLALDVQGPVPDFKDLPLAEVRSTFEAAAAKLGRVGDPVGRVEDRVVAGAVPVRVYTPRGAGPFPVAVFFHGGGWVYGDLDTHDDLCRSLCSRAPAVVVAVKYRLAPETRFPGALDDAFAAVRWAASLGPRLSVCGDSAGGNLAAAVCLRAREEGGPRIDLQALAYPVTDRMPELPSYRAFERGFGLTLSNMRWFWDCYLGEAPTGPLAAPLVAKDLHALPRAFFTLADCDVLRDEGIAYAERLAAAGVPVDGVVYRGMNHGFLRMGAYYPQALRALDDLAAALAGSA
jgi:acetyl esterase